MLLKEESPKIDFSIFQAVISAALLSYEYASTSEILFYDVTYLFDNVVPKWWYQRLSHFKILLMPVREQSLDTAISMDQAFARGGIGSFGI